MESNESIKVYIGFIAYNDQTAKYLPDFLPSLKSQTYKNVKILAIDNSERENNKNHEFIKNNYPDIDFKWAGKNLGFAKAYNLMIQQAVNSGAEYFLALNPDMILEPEMLERLVKAMQGHNKIAAVQPKILKLNFENNAKTNIVDSYGVICDQRFRFRDKNQGQIDNKSNGVEEIFGFTGAAVLLNLKAIQEIAFNNGNNFEYFDELMFMYKEDCDLSLRLRLAGYKIVLAFEAVVYHGRTASRTGDSLRQIIKNRKGKRRQLKEWSFRGQWLIVLKYVNLNFSFKTKFLVWWYQIEIITFSLLFEQFLLKELIELWQIRHKIKMRKDQLKVKIDLKEIERIME